MSARSASAFHTGRRSAPGPVPGAGLRRIRDPGRRHYPVKQVGQVVTRQDRRDFSAAEVLRAMTQLGFTCRALPAAAPVRVLSPLQHASAMLGTPVSV